MAKKTSKKETPVNLPEATTNSVNLPNTEVPLPTLVRVVLQLRTERIGVYGEYDEDRCISDAYQLVSKCARKIFTAGEEEKKAAPAHATVATPAQGANEVSFAAAIKIITSQKRGGNRPLQSFKSFLEHYLRDVFPPYPRADESSKTDHNGAEREKAKKGNTEKPFTKEINDLVSIIAQKEIAGKKIPGKFTLAEVEVLKKHFDLHKPFRKNELPSSLSSEVNAIIAKRIPSMERILETRRRIRTTEVVIK